MYYFMRKKILFIISNMESGGVSKSMLSLLHTVDKVKYEVDLLVVNPSGIFMEQLPEGINIIKDEKAALFFSAFPGNLATLLKKGYGFAAFCRVWAAVLSLINRGWAGLLMSKFLPALPAIYDVAVDYNGQQQLYYLIDRIKARKKVTFFHSDYKQWDYYFSIDNHYFPKVDKIFTISEICAASLIDYFPDQQEKIDIFENISAPSLIYKMADEYSEIPYASNNLLTVGHVCENKGSSLALQAAKLLKQKGVDFTWHFIGKVTNDMDYVKMVKEFGLEKHVVFLGLRANPYPFMKKASIVVHPSKFEGKSIALDEVKILCKPVVVTNFSTVTDQFTHRYNATIVEMQIESIAEAIHELIQDKSLREMYELNLRSNIKDNTSEVEKLYSIVG